jgi:protein-tyrosine phosphatase
MIVSRSGEDAQQIKILFVCLGNICRSPMAEFVMKDLVKKRGLSQHFFIFSAGTSGEEEGSGVHRGTVNKLKSESIPLEAHYAGRITKYDYERYDYILGMEERNVRAMTRAFGGDRDKKLFRLLDFCAKPRDIADPWWTGDFDAAYEDIAEGCNCFLDFIIEKHGLHNSSV